MAGRAFAIMANRTETRPQQLGNAVDRSILLRKVMEGLSVKGFAKTSIADLTSAAGVDYGTLHREFGTRDEILCAAIQFCAETEASLAHEPLRVSPTGREAILSMLKRIYACVGIGPDTVAACLRSTPLSFLRKTSTCWISSPKGAARF